MQINLEKIIGRHFIIVSGNGAPKEIRTLCKENYKDYCDFIKNRTTYNNYVSRLAARKEQIKQILENHYKLTNIIEVNILLMDNHKSYTTDVLSYTLTLKTIDEGKEKASNIDVKEDSLEFY